MDEGILGKPAANGIEIFQAITLCEDLHILLRLFDFFKPRREQWDKTNHTIKLKEKQRTNKSRKKNTQVDYQRESKSVNFCKTHQSRYRTWKSGPKFLKLQSISIPAVYIISSFPAVHIISFCVSFLSRVDELNILAASSVLIFIAQLVEHSKRERRDHGFESRWSPEKHFFGLLCNCLIAIHCDGHTFISFEFPQCTSFHYIIHFNPYHPKQKNTYTDRFNALSNFSQNLTIYCFYYIDGNVTIDFSQCH